MRVVEEDVFIALGWVGFVASSWGAVLLHEELRTALAQRPPAAAALSWP